MKMRIRSMICALLLASFGCSIMPQKQQIANLTATLERHYKEFKKNLYRIKKCYISKKECPPEEKDKARIALRNIGIVGVSIVTTLMAIASLLVFYASKTKRPKVEIKRDIPSLDARRMIPKNNVTFGKRVTPLDAGRGRMIPKGNVTFGKNAPSTGVYDYTQRYLASTPLFRDSYEKAPGRKAREKAPRRKARIEKKSVIITIPFEQDYINNPQQLIDDLSALNENITRLIIQWPYTSAFKTITAADAAVTIKYRKQSYQPSIKKS